MSIGEVYQHHSLVIAAEYRIPDPSRVAPLLAGRREALAEHGVHHILVFRSLDETGRVLVMIGVHSREPIVDLMRSRVFFDWFDEAGVEDFPAVFAGEIVERFGMTEESERAPSTGVVAPGVVVAAIVSVDDIAVLTIELRRATERFKSAGIRKVWVFHAFDDSREVLVLQEIDDEDSARRWIDHPDEAAQWMSRAGIGVYPPLFLGEFDSLVRIPEA